ncbi:MAG: C-terminal binding protein [Planctomycetes bacterium]|nr:C-terminal binding protein [Planctomycetota bacterium]MCH9726870.1 C-terminal binding protein [Planctomycetota bacterium]MCH9775554.1 C-terminal binding protein [Planctomycetota bacterium]MCH9792489.1 C-terminal binding protein [Planctomycetota bacterium]
MSAKFRVLITDRAWPDCEVEQKELALVDAEVIEAPPGADEQTLIQFATGVDAIATCWAPVTKAVIAAAPDCKTVARLGIGLDNIDVEYATSLKIPVTNVPDYCIPEVADHTIALMLARLRNVAFFHLQTKQGIYELASAPLPRRLSALTMGVFGFGLTGQAVAQRARAFGMNVIATNTSGNDYGTGTTMVPFHELIQQSDVISIHAPLTDATLHQFDTNAFSQMKPTAFLINTSRGALIDFAALKTAIENNTIAGAALDVFDPEPPDLNDPFFKDERVILTPHAAFISKESLDELRQQAAHQIAEILVGKQTTNVVNPAVFE